MPWIKIPELSKRVARRTSARAVKAAWRNHASHQTVGAHDPVARPAAAAAAASGGGCGGPLQSCKQSTAKKNHPQTPMLRWPPPAKWPPSMMSHPLCPVSRRWCSAVAVRADQSQRPSYSRCVLVYVGGCRAIHAAVNASTGVNLTRRRSAGGSWGRVEGHLLEAPGGQGLPHVILRRWSCGRRKRRAVPARTRGTSCAARGCGGASTARGP